MIKLERPIDDEDHLAIRAGLTVFEPEDELLWRSGPRTRGEPQTRIRRQAPSIIERNRGDQTVPPRRWSPILHEVGHFPHLCQHRLFRTLCQGGPSIPRVFLFFWRQRTREVERTGPHARARAPYGTPHGTCNHQRFQQVRGQGGTENSMPMVMRTDVLATRVSSANERACITSQALCMLT